MLAFTDKWKWTEDAAQQYKELTAPGGPQRPALEWFGGILGESGALAYLVHMAARFPELHRVLGPRGGLFLHVDAEARGAAHPHHQPGRQAGRRPARP